MEVKRIERRQGEREERGKRKERRQKLLAQSRSNNDNKLNRKWTPAQMSEAPTQLTLVS